MCGIAGWFSQSDQPLPDAQLRLARMRSSLAHRGPDGFGEWLAPGVGLAHTRLSIIDLAGGTQPMHSQNAAAAIVFNGEIYNFRELAKWLSSRGRKIISQSDTEVLLEWYLCNGIEGLQQLRGMYACAIWDSATATGVLIRDPAGIKPLFYSECAGNLVFGSEAKAILASGWVAPEMDESSLHLLLNFRYLPFETTMLRGVQQLAPGEVISWRAGEITRHHFSFARRPQTSIVGALRDSVSHHLIADVPVGAYLSGGLDSAAVVALAREQQSIETFSIAIGDDPNEAINAAETARLLGVPNTRLPDIRIDSAKLTSLLWHLETPKVNALQVALLAEATAERTKVVLSGLGGDEFFLGYRWHGWYTKALTLSRFAPSYGWSTTTRGLAALMRAVNPIWSEPERALLAAGAVIDPPKLYGLIRNLWDTPRMRRAVYGPRMLDAKLPDAFASLRAHWPSDPDPVLAAAAFERRQKLVGDLLWNEDRCSMSVGLEVRTPFVDAAIMSVVADKGRSELMPKGQPKGLLRQSLREFLPEPLFNRPKSGFQIDAGSFFAQHLRGLVDQWLSPEQVRQFGIFNPQFIEALLRLSTKRIHRWHYLFLLMVLSTHIWVEVFEHSKGSPRPWR